VSFPSPSPTVVVLAGPNGAGKSTSAPTLLRGQLRVDEFVNADTIARGLSAFAPDSAAIDAGRVMLRRLQQLAGQRRSFAFETTLASRSFAPRITSWIEGGYSFHLVFLWLPSAELALARVRERVRLGGHDVPADTIRRRYVRGVRNFFALYQPLATTWRFYDNANARPRLIARGSRNQPTKIADTACWTKITEDQDGR
jgi:predicted ABC-type ATPase